MFLSLDIRDYNNVRIAMKTASGDMHVMHVPPMLSPCLFYRQEDNITRIVQQMILFCETYNTPLRKIRALTLLFSTQEPEANKDRIKNYLCSLFTPELVYSEYKKNSTNAGDDIWVQNIHQSIISHIRKRLPVPASEREKKVFEKVLHFEYWRTLWAFIEGKESIVLFDHAILKKYLQELLTLQNEIKYSKEYIEQAINNQWYRKPDRSIHRTRRHARYDRWMQPLQKSNKHLWPL